MNQNEFIISDFLQQKVKQQFKQLTEQQMEIEQEEEYNNNEQDNQRQNRNNNKKKNFVLKKEDLDIVAMGDTNQVHLNLKDEIKEEDEEMMKQHLQPETFEQHKKEIQNDQQEQQIIILSEKKLRQILGLEEQKTFENVQQMLDLNEFNFDCSGYPLNKTDTQNLLMQAAQKEPQIYLDTYDDGSQILRIGQEQFQICQQNDPFQNSQILGINKSQLKVIQKYDNVNVGTLEYIDKKNIK